MPKPPFVSRRNFLAATAVASPMLAAGMAEAAAAGPRRWTRTADVVVIGSGATGLPAAIAAREAGASVILLEAERDVGGHAMCSGGNVALGGGTPRQRRYGIVDSPDLIFSDLTDWSVVEPNGAADYRYNDRELVRAFADINPAAFDWLVAHGVVFVDQPLNKTVGGSIGNSAPRVNNAAPMDWPLIQTGRPAPADQRLTASSGNGLMRPLEAAARKAGVDILLHHRMTGLVREAPRAGRVLGVQATAGGKALTVKAHKAVILATGGSSGNVNFRRMFDPRLTEEYCGLAGMPWSHQDASGELAAMDVGASLWGLANQTGEFGSHLTKAGNLGTRYGYRYLQWYPGSPVFEQAVATGLIVTDWQNLILVNMIGKRFYDETGQQFTSNKYKSIDPYTPHSFHNPADLQYRPNNFINAALAGIGDGHNGGGPIWAIFDADAVAREGWIPSPPHVDSKGGFFFQADTIAELARSIAMPYQRSPMPPDALEETIARYNGFVAAGRDEEFDKPTPSFRIARAPFYAAWATPVIHDTRAGLRINGQCQVLDMGRRRDRRPLLRGRIRGRIQPARPCPRDLPGAYCGAAHHRMIPVSTVRVRPVARGAAGPLA